MSARLAAKHAEATRRTLSANARWFRERKMWRQAERVEELLARVGREEPQA